MIRALVLAACLAAGLPARSADAYRAPRTAYGQPDLQGTWTNASLTSLERPDRFPTVVVPEAQARAYEKDPPRAPAIPGDDVGQDDTEWWEMGAGLARIRGQARAAWIVEPADGRLPLTEAGRKAVVIPPAGFEGPEARPLTDRCLSFIGSPAGPPMLNAAYNGNYQILQTRDHVAILVEMNTALRIIRLGAKPAATPIPRWMGESVGRWEGETLVVETTNMHPLDSRRSGPRGRLYSSPGARIVERFTRIADKEILYEFTILDPATYSGPWRAEMVFQPSPGRIFEMACHEGNYSMANILAGARQAEAAAREAAPTAAPRRTAP
jgi:hypothetical protein